MRYSCLLLFTLFASATLSQSPVVAGENYIRVLSSDSKSVVIEFMAPSLGEKGLPFFIEPVNLEGQTFQRLTLRGLTHIVEAGKPQLPIKGFLLQIPANAQVDLQVESKESMTYSGYRIPPAVEFEIGKAGSGMKKQFLDSDSQTPKSEIRNRLYFDTAIYSRDAFYPQHPAKIEALGFLRQAHVANVSIYPIQYNPGRNEVRFHRRLQLTVSFQYSQKSLNQTRPSQAPSVNNHDAVTENSDFQQIYRDVIVNFKPNFQPLKPVSPPAPPKENYSGSTTYKLIVDQDGIYRLTYQDLKQAGIDVAEINPKTLKLTNKGNAIPILVSGENDGAFDRMDYVEFRGEFNRGTYSLFGEYTTENVYWLSWGEHLERGARIAIEDANPEKNHSIAVKPESYRAVVHFEQDKFRSNLGYADIERDFWFWKRLPSGIHEYPFE